MPRGQRGARRPQGGRRPTLSSGLALLIILASLVAFAAPATAAGVTDLSAPRPTSSAASATGVRYEVDFTITAALTSDSTISITVPAGTVLSRWCSDARVHLRLSEQSVGCGGTLSPDGQTITLDISTNVPASSQLRVRLHNVTNPPSPRSDYTFTVWTSSDAVPVTSPPYTITAGSQSVSDVSAPRLTSTAASAPAVDYELDFTLSPTGGLTHNSTVTVTVPPGTVLSRWCSDARVHLRVTDRSVGCGGTISPDGRTITINIHDDVPASSLLRVHLNNVTNPPGPGSFTFSVSTTSDPVPVTSPPYTITAGSQSVSDVSAPRLTSSAASAPAVDYELDFTLSPTGALTHNSTVTVTVPPGT
ncbi:MAG: hypothetical protein M3203_07660, partial [Actinomycetota bacterium]|nr:hypothetical protein [Actinomycetota bacterium]